MFMPIKNKLIKHEDTIDYIFESLTDHQCQVLVEPLYAGMHVQLYYQKNKDTGESQLLLIDKNYKVVNKKIKQNLFTFRILH